MPSKTASANEKQVTCCNCDKDCTSHHWMCDEETDDAVWCPECWEKTACAAGVHGEGCPTQVFTTKGGSD